MSVRRTSAGVRVLGAGAAVAMTAGLALSGAGQASAASRASAQDTTFLVAAHQSNLAEIGSGTLAQTRAIGSDIKAEGRMWISDHTKLDAAGAALAKTYAITLPTTPDAEQRTAAAGLGARTGSAFDAYWIKVGLTGHLETLAAVKKEIADGTATDFVAAAKMAEPIVVAHVAALEALARTYGVATPTSVAAGTGGQAAEQGNGPSALGLPLVTVGLVAAGVGGWSLRRRGRGAASV